MDGLDKRRRNRLREIAPDFNNSGVSAVDLLDHLPCIKAKGSREKIERIWTNRGPSHGLRELCSVLPGHTNWFDELIDGLKALGGDEIADLLKKDKRGSLLSKNTNTYRQQSYNDQQHLGTPPFPLPPEGAPYSSETPVRILPSGVKNALAIMDISEPPSKNWSDLAAFFDVSWEDSQWLEKSSKPSKQVIEKWSEKHPSHATLGNLLMALQTLERLDVVEEINRVLDRTGDVTEIPNEPMAAVGQDAASLLRNIEKPQPVSYNNNLGVSEAPRTQPPLDPAVRQKNLEKSAQYDHDRGVPLDVEDQFGKLSHYQDGPRDVSDGPRPSPKKDNSLVEADSGHSSSPIPSKSRMEKDRKSLSLDHLMEKGNQGVGSGLEQSHSAKIPAHGGLNAPVLLPRPSVDQFSTSMKQNIPNAHGRHHQPMDFGGGGNSTQGGDERNNPSLQNQRPAGRSPELGRNNGAGVQDRAGIYRPGNHGVGHIPNGTGNLRNERRDSGRQQHMLDDQTVDGMAIETSQERGHQTGCDGSSEESSRLIIASSRNDLSEFQTPQRDRDMNVPGNYSKNYRSPQLGVDDRAESRDSPDRGVRTNQSPNITASEDRSMSASSRKNQSEFQTPQKDRNLNSPGSNSKNYRSPEMGVDDRAGSGDSPDRGVRLNQSPNITTSEVRVETRTTNNSPEDPSRSDQCAGQKMDSVNRKTQMVCGIGTASIQDSAVLTEDDISDKPATSLASLDPHLDDVVIEVSEEIDLSELVHQELTAQAKDSNGRYDPNPPGGVSGGSTEGAVGPAALTYPRDAGEKAVKHRHGGEANHGDSGGHLQRGDPMDGGAGPPAPGNHPRKGRLLGQIVRPPTEEGGARAKEAVTRKSVGHRNGGNGNPGDGGRYQSQLGGASRNGVVGASAQSSVSNLETGRGRNPRQPFGDTSPGQAKSGSGSDSGHDTDDGHSSLITEDYTAIHGEDHASARSNLHQWGMAPRGHQGGRGMAPGGHQGGRGVNHAGARGFPAGGSEGGGEEGSTIRVEMKDGIGVEGRDGHGREPAGGLRDGVKRASIPGKQDNHIGGRSGVLDQQRDGLVANMGAQRPISENQCKESPDDEAFHRDGPKGLRGISHVSQGYGMMGRGVEVTREASVDQSRGHAHAGGVKSPPITGLKGPGYFANVPLNRPPPDAGVEPVGGNGRLQNETGGGNGGMEIPTDVFRPGLFGGATGGVAVDDRGVGVGLGPQDKRVGLGRAPPQTVNITPGVDHREGHETLQEKKQNATGGGNSPSLTGLPHSNSDSSPKPLSSRNAGSVVDNGATGLGSPSTATGVLTGLPPSDSESSPKPLSSQDAGSVVDNRATGLGGLSTATGVLTGLPPSDSESSPKPLSSQDAGSVVDNRATGLGGLSTATGVSTGLPPSDSDSSPKPLSSQDAGSVVDNRATGLGGPSTATGVSTGLSPSDSDSSPKPLSSRDAGSVVDNRATGLGGPATGVTGLPTSESSPKSLSSQEEGTIRSDRWSSKANLALSHILSTFSDPTRF